ncbi:MAG: Grx4 family monothiol glutaredoxin [Myxococcota bacterium]|nr:Grx4 family monothiol glutaredoxin [Myxococcota bacterium]
MDEQLRQRIDQMIQNNRILLFMKGDRSQPRCGFSARLAGILNELDVAFETVDILHPNNQDLRAGMKDYSSWPTFPQLYIEQEFVGGSDIVSQMFASGELQQMLGVVLEEVPMPAVTMTPAIIEAFEQATARYPGVVRVDINAQFQVDIGVGPAEDSDYVVESNGFAIHMSRNSAKRADGLKLDFHPNMGVIVDNPNAPASVKQMDVQSLKSLMESGKSFTLFDVRSPQEMATASISGATPFTVEALQALETDSLIVFQCHHGGRSMQAAQSVLAEGYTNVYNLAGGIHAWSLHIDSSVPTY